MPARYLRQLALSVLMIVSVLEGKSQFPIGSWKGNLHFNGTAIPVIFHIHSENSILKGTMDSPQQGAVGLQIDSVGSTKDSLTIVYKTANMIYRGRYTNITDSVYGTLYQNGMSLPLVLGFSNDGGTSNQLNRPQTPSYNVDYNIEEVEIPNKNAHINLAGTLTLPLKKTKPACIVLVSGSGPQNRDGEIFGHKPFWVLADFLTKNGYAVLRYDDRGTAKSKGNYETATIDDFASDAYASIEYLKTRNDIGKIGIAGHSEGGGIIQQVAATYPKDVAFVVMLAGAGVRGDSLMLLQKKAIESKLNVSQKEVQQGLQTFRNAYNIILDNPQWSHGMPIVKQYFFERLQELNPEKNDRNIVAIQQAITNTITPEIYSIIRFNPAQYLPAVVCPILALNGSKDVQVLPQENLNAIRTLTSGNKRVTIKELPGLNHLFQEADSGMPNEYGKITQTFSPVAMNYILEWLKNNGF